MVVKLHFWIFIFLKIWLKVIAYSGFFKLFLETFLARSLWTRLFALFWNVKFLCLNSLVQNLECRSRFVILNLMFFVTGRELNFDFVILDRFLRNRLLFVIYLVRQSVRHTVDGNLLVVVVFSVWVYVFFLLWLWLRLWLLPASKNANYQRNDSN